VAVLPPGMTEPGLNEHFKLLGTLEQARATAVSNDPDCGVTSTTNLPELPEARIMVGGLTIKLSFELLPLPQLRVVFTAGEIWFVIPGLPTAWT